MSESIRWPAEWEAQAAVLLTWPQPEGDFADFPAAEQNFIGIADQIAPLAALIVSANNAHQARRIEQQLAHLGSRATVYVVPSNDIWVRDHGPVGVVASQQIQLNNFGFDGWGGKYDSARDNAVTTNLAKLGALSPFGTLVTQNLTLEGGAIETDGCGTLLATKSSVLDPQRNPGLTQSAIENHLSSALGIQHFLWLENGDLIGDDTDGHIDTLARFVAPDHIVYQSSQFADLPNHRSLTRMAQELSAFRQKDGREYKLTPLPHTEVAHDMISGQSGITLPTSYANFLMLNGHVLLPQYGDPSDALALQVLQDACPALSVIGVDCRALVTQFGSLHCATMNIPAAPSPDSNISIASATDTPL